jgi:hypothetical protein
MHTPVGAFAAGSGNTGAIGQAYRASRPVQPLAGRFCRQQMLHDGLEKVHRLVEAVFDGGIGQGAQTQHSRPARGVA